MNTAELNPIDLQLQLAESMRMKELESLETVIEESESSLQSMSELLAKLCGVPISGVSLVDSNTVWIKAHYGIQAVSLPRRGAFCGAAIDANEELFVVENAMEDPRFCNNPIVANAPGIRFYAAYAFQGGRGFPVGTLWMMDTKPIRINDEKRVILKCLGAYLDQSIQDMYRCSITGLPNRHSFLRRLQAMLNQADRKVSTAFIRLHRMQHLAGTYGIEFRDAIIRQFADRLNMWCKGGLLAHFDGGKFGFAWPGSYDKDELRQVMYALESPVTEDGVTVAVNISVGIASAEPGQACAAALAELAEQAASERQRLGFSNIHYQDGVANQRLAKDLDACLHRDSATNHFYPAYQPQVDAMSGKIYGYEALLRWHNPELSSTPLWQVLSQIESMGKTPALDMLMFDKVCRDLVSWQQRKLGLPKVSVNITRTTLQDEDLPQKLTEITNKHGLENSMLMLEITESGEALDDKVMYRHLNNLRDAGFAMAIDDFGTGMSNIGTLQNIKWNLIKVDRQFAHGVASTPHIAALLRLIKGTADSMGVPLLVEGVEEQEDIDWLIEAGIFLIQGWYFAKAVREETVVKLLTNPPAPTDQILRLRIERVKCLLDEAQRS